MSTGTNQTAKFWIRFDGLLNRRLVLFTKGQIETKIAWEGGEEFGDSPFYQQAQVTLLDAMKPYPQVAGSKVVVTTTLELLPTSQRAAEEVLKKLGWEISPLADYEMTLVEKGKI